MRHECQFQGILIPICGDNYIEFRQSFIVGTSSGQLSKSMEKIPGWDRHLEYLANQGFFQDEKVGSSKHKQLMHQAAEAFQSSESYSKHQAIAQAPADRILSLLDKEFDPSKVSSKNSLRISHLLHALCSG